MRYYSDPDYPERRVYFIRPIGQDGPIKIGSSRWPEERLASYTRWSPYPLEIVVSVPGTMKVEMAIHRCFADARSHEEWFRPIPRLLAVIEKLVEGVPLEKAINLSSHFAERRAKQLAVQRAGQQRRAAARLSAAREASAE
jgi:hypothetical protein